MNVLGNVYQVRPFCGKIHIVGFANIIFRRSRSFSRVGFSKNCAKASCWSFASFMCFLISDRIVGRIWFIDDTQTLYSTVQHPNRPVFIRPHVCVARLLPHGGLWRLESVQRFHAHRASAIGRIGNSRSGFVFGCLGLTAGIAPAAEGLNFMRLEMETFLGRRSETGENARDRKRRIWNPGRNRITDAIAARGPRPLFSHHVPSNASHPQEPLCLAPESRKESIGGRDILARDHS